MITFLLLSSGFPYDFAEGFVAGSSLAIAGNLRWFFWWSTVVGGGGRRWRRPWSRDRKAFPAYGNEKKRSWGCEKCCDSNGNFFHPQNSKNSWGSCKNKFFCYHVWISGFRNQISVGASGPDRYFCPCWLRSAEAASVKCQTCGEGKYNLSG